VPAPTQPVSTNTVDTPPTEQHSSLSAPVSKPGKPPKPEVPQPNIHPYGDPGSSSSHRHSEEGEGGGGGGGGGGGCHDDSYESDSDSGDDGQGQGAESSSYQPSGRRHSGREGGFSPPGLFKKRYAPGD
jgi:hypothetical protein